MKVQILFLNSTLRMWGNKVKHALKDILGIAFFGVLAGSVSLTRMRTTKAGQRNPLIVLRVLYTNFYWILLTN